MKTVKHEIEIDLEDGDDREFNLLGYRPPVKGEYYYNMYDKSMKLCEWDYSGSYIVFELDEPLFDLRSDYFVVPNKPNRLSSLFTISDGHLSVGELKLDKYMRIDLMNLLEYFGKHGKLPAMVVFNPFACYSPISKEQTK